MSPKPIYHDFSELFRQTLQSKRPLVRLADLIEWDRTLTWSVPVTSNLNEIIRPLFNRLKISCGKLPQLMEF